MTTADQIRERRRADLRSRADLKGICKICRFCAKHCEGHGDGDSGPMLIRAGTVGGLCGACIGGEGYRAGYDRWGVWGGPAVPLGTWPAPEPGTRSDCPLNVSAFRELYDAAMAMFGLGGDHPNEADWTRLRAALEACCGTAPDDIRPQLLDGDDV